MRIVAFSDTHGLHANVAVPDGDVLVFAGDMMNSGRHVYELNSFVDWFRALPHKHKVVIAGNHDRLLETYGTDKFEGCHYLCDSGCVINNYEFWGSPYTPEFCNWAFAYERGQGYKHWDLIPITTDVLITHGPPYGILDGPRLGCPELEAVLGENGACWHIFGHIHSGFGQMNIGIYHYNVSICDEQYRPVNPCTIIDLP
jgi:Icc-related predicted phosphoesterase